MRDHEENEDILNEEAERETAAAETEEVEAAEESEEDAEVTLEAEGAEDSEESEDKAPAEPFDEAQLLELAKSEGLADAMSEPEEAAAPEEIDLSEAEQAQIMASMETILFMTDKPVSLPKLRSVINNEVKLPVYRTLMARLREEFNRDHRGVEIAEVALGFQLRTKPHMSSVLRKMVKTQPLKLSTATMEVLAIVAYKQPVTKDELDQIRSVDCGYVLRNLMEKRLVKIAGRSELPGKPILYGTTHEFLELFGLKDLQSLPPLHEVESMVAASEIGLEEKAQAAMQEFGKMIASSDKILFDDSQIDTELEALRAEIASVPTSTSFLEEQKAREKMDAKLAELAAQGLTMDSEGNIVPIGSIPAMATSTILADSDVAIELNVEGNMAAVSTATEASEELRTDAEPAAEAPSEEHTPSPELEAAAEAAQWERHAEIISQAVAESEVVMVNAEALANAVSEAQAEQDLDAEQAKGHNPELG